jgi:fibronectin-binding autotransporter adhesin
MQIHPLSSASPQPHPKAIAVANTCIRWHRAKIAFSLASLVPGLLALPLRAQTVSLGAAENFAVLGNTTVTNTGATAINGSLGLNPGTSVTGFPPGTVTNGTIQINTAQAIQGQADAFTAYMSVAGEAFTTDLTGMNLGGLTLTPGTYHFNTSAQLTGTLTLNTEGDPDAAFHFQIGSTLTAATSSAIVLLGLNGTPEQNIFWQVGSSATLGVNSSFDGNIIADTSITLDAGASLNGRALALNGAVTLDTNAINAQIPVPVIGGTYWNGGASNLWSGVNWSPDATGATTSTLNANADVVFSVTGIVPQNQNTNLDVDTTISSLTVNDPVAVTISGAHLLTIDGSGVNTGITINSGAGLTTINSNVTLAGLSQTVTVDNTAGLVINGVVAGTVGLDKAGPGQLTLTGVETYTGGTSITGGTLQLGDGTTVGSSIAAGGLVTIGNTGTLALNLANGETFANTVADNGLVVMIATGTNTLSGPISGSGGLIQNGTGLSILSGANTYTGATAVLRGTLQIGNGVNGSIAAGSPVMVLGGTLALDLANGGIFGNDVADSALVSTISAGTNTLAGIVSGAGAFTQDGTGRSILAGADTYTGATTVLQGTLQIGNGLSGSLGGVSPVTVSGGTLALNLAGGGVFANNVTNDSLVTTIASGTNVLTGVISGPGALTQNGAGLSVLTGANTYTGATAVLQGTLQIGNGLSGSLAGVSPVTISGGTLALNLAGGAVFANNVTNDSLVTTIASGTNVLTGIISGSGVLTQNGVGRSILTGANTYTGATTVLRGALQIGDGVSGSIAPASPVTVGTGGTLAVDLANGGTFTNNVANTGLVTAISAGTNTVAGIVSGAGAFTQNGTGRSVLTGANTYTGATTVLQGTLQIGNGLIGSISAASPVTITGGTLVLDLAVNGTFANNVADAGLVTSISGGANTLSGMISGTGALTQNGTGLTLLTGANTFTGPTTVLQGTLQVGNGRSGSIAASSPVTVAGGTLALDLANGATFGNNVANAGLVTAISSGTNTLSGVIADTGAFAQNGAGRSILTGANTYIGATTVLQGALQIGDGVSGSIALASPVTVGTGGTLALDLANGGTFANNVANTGLVTAISAGANTVAGTVSGAGDFTQNGTGVSVLTGANTYTGATTVLQGTLQIGNGLSGSLAGVSPVTVSGGTLALNLAGGGVFANDVINDSLVTTIASGTNVLTGIINGPGALTQNGVGRSILTGANTYTGATTVLHGALQIGDGVSGSIALASPVTVGTGGTLAVDLADGGTFANNVANTGLVTAISAGTNTLAGIVSGAGAFTQNGTGLSVLTGADTYTGATTVLQGTLQIGNGLSGSLSGVSPVAASGGTLALNLAEGGVFANNVTNDSLVTTIASGTNVLTGRISGSGAFTQNGVGRSILTDADTYTGATTVLQGTLQVGNGGSGSIAPASPVTVETGGTLAVDLANGGTFANNVANTGLVTAISAGTNTVAGIVSGAGDFTQNGTGRSVLTGANTYTGATTVLQGALQIGNGLSGSIAVASPVTVGTGGTLAVDLANGGTFANNVANTGLVTAISAGTNTVAGTVSGAGAFTQNGTGRSILTGDNTYTGATTVLQGALQIGDGVSGSIALASPVTVGAGGTLAVDLANGGTFANDVANTGLVAAISAGTNTVAGTVSGAGDLTQNGTGRSILTGANIYTGATTVLQGTLQVGNGLSGSIAASSPVKVAGGTLAIDLANGATFANNVANTGLVTTISSGTNTLSGVVADTGAFTQNGAGRTILTGANTYTGATTVLQGTLQVGNGTTGSISPASPVTVSGGTPASTRAVSAAGQKIAKAAAVGGGTLALDLANGAIFANQIANAGLVTTVAAGTNTLSGIMSGPGAFTQNGPGLTILTAANTYTGATTVLQGTLQAGAPAVIPTASAVLVNTGATFDLDGRPQSVGSIANGPGGGGAIALGTATLTTGNDGTNTAFAGIISGPGAVTKTGVGTWTVSGSNTYTGATTVAAGTLKAGAAHVIAATSAVNLHAGGMLDLDGFSQSIGSLAGAGPVELGAATLVTGNDNSSTVYSGTISGPGATQKVGAGTWDLTGNNTYAGLTTIDAGTLAVDGAIAGDALVSAGILRGVGKIGGNAVNNAMVIPGTLSAPGTLTIGGNYNQNAPGSFDVRLASASNYDRLAVGGAATLDGTLQVTYLNGFNARPGNVFTIITAANGVNGQFASFDDAHATTLVTLGVVYQKNAVLLEFGQGSFAAQVPINQCDSNELAVAKSLDKLAVSQPDNKVVLDLDSLPLAQLPGSFSLLSPEDFAAIFTAGLAVSQVEVTNIELRLDEVRQGAIGFSDSGFALQSSTGAVNRDDKSVIRTDNSKGSEQFVTPTVETDRWGFFISGIGAFGDLDSACPSRGSSFTTGGVTLGADYRVTNHLIVGAAADYANTASDLSGGGDLAIQGGKGSLYTTYYDRGFYVNGIAGGGYSSYDTKRYTLGGFANGGTSATDFDGLVGTGYDFHFGGFTVGPIASLGYTTVGLDAFQEHGAVGALRFGSQSQDSLKSAAGLKAAYSRKIGRVVITPEIRAQWEHEYLDSQSTIDAGFAAGNSFTVHGPPIGRDGALIDAGVSAALTSNLTIFAYYTGELGRENYSVHSVNGGMSVGF